MLSFNITSFYNLSLRGNPPHDKWKEYEDVA